ncbi:hypothetical protein D9615_006759 [Tricholomella constricta]|uniref:Uncharacterized protein n=1 Tax=Tricholomella constricta TaxID=117010 RepID=A0A8H5H6N7_9AGAR|nr:hypothetical protein D9615_006759 [Tricholomella constricta]
MPACYKSWQDALSSEYNVPSPLGPKRKATKTPEDSESNPPNNNDSEPILDAEDVFELPHEPPNKRPRVEEVEDEGEPQLEPRCTRYVKEYPLPAGQWIRQAKSSFELLLERQVAAGKAIWEPFASEDEWQLAMWLMKNASQKSTDEYLKLPIKVDALPTGPEWKCDIVKVQGDQVDEDGEMMEENLELWMRDPVECIRELMGNPAFREFMAFAPEQVFTDEACSERIFDEMWTADWWWKIQKLLPTGATLAPIILSSDKTQLSQFQGDKKAWPVYLTIGNLSKDIRRQPSAHATVLVGYLPLAKLDCYSEAKRSLAGYRLFHYCMFKILEPLVNAGKQGVEMVCSDGHIRRVYPILAAYVADYPEQCLVACCMENRCPRCVVDPNQRGSPVESLARDVDATLKTLDEHKRGQEPPQFENEGLRAVYQPFWRHLPHCNIFASFTPDLLHQIHKGVFKDHFVKWCTSIIGESEVDARFKAMSDFPGLRHFKKGISSVSQWTGTELKEMEKVFLGILAGAVNSEVLTIARALLDFIYYSQYQSHTSTTLRQLESSLRTFHAHKDVFIKLEIHEHFDIPKLHSIMHYVDAIKALGSADGYNSESPERLHIDFAKEAYRASNKRDYTEQMALWLQRREAMWTREAFCAWINGSLTREAKSSPSANGLDEDDDVDIDIVTDSRAEPQIPAPQPCTTTAVPVSYAIAKSPSFKNVTVERIHSEFGAVDFIPALTNFLRTSLPSTTILPNQLDRFDLFRQIVRYILTNRIRTTPAIKPNGRKLGSPPHFDTALIIENLAEHRQSGGFSGLRPAQVRVIFILPPHLGTYLHPLAYIEWFTPLGRPDNIIGMHTISRSTRQRRRNAAVIPVTLIARGCHLMAKSGARIDRHLTTDNALELATHSYLNPYIHVDTFSIIK